MFERFTERARRVLFFARYEATQLGSTSITPEHLLLGLIREGKGITSRIFARAHSSLEDIRRDIEGRTVLREKVSTSVEIPFDPDTKRVLQFTAEESDRLGHVEIGTEHMLLAILRVESSLAASLLMKRGLSLESVREQVVALRAERSERSDNQPTAPTPVLPPFGVRVSVTTRGAGLPGRPAAAPWTMEGVSVRAALSKIHGVPVTRIELPARLDDDELYDVELVPPQPLVGTDRTASFGLANQGVFGRLVREPFERLFRITASSETRHMEVLALTAPEAPARPTQDASSHTTTAYSGGVEVADFDIEFTMSVAGPAAGHAATSLRAMSGATSMDNVRGALESHLRRIVVDETHLTGTYRIDVRSTGAGPHAFVDALRDQAGLVLTPVGRDVALLVVREK